MLLKGNLRKIDEAEFIICSQLLVMKYFTNSRTAREGYLYTFFLFSTCQCSVANFAYLWHKKTLKK